MGEPWAWLDGCYIPQDQARLPCFDAGLVLGATVTDLCRTFQHRFFRLDDHLRRFEESAQAACIPLRVGRAELAAIGERLLDFNGPLLPPGMDLVLVMFATPGPVGYYAGLPGGAGDGPPTLCLHTFPLDPRRFRHLFTHGAELRVPQVRAVPAECVPPAIKQRSRMHWWLADREVRAGSPGAMALLLDLDGHVTETAGANLLIVREGTVLTPPRDSVLPGISLRMVEEVCADLGIPFVERPLGLAECQAADEAMLSNTSWCLAGVRSLDGVAVPWPGPVHRRLLGEWSRRVGLDLAAQAVATVS